MRVEVNNTQAHPFITDAERAILVQFFVIARTRMVRVHTIEGVEAIGVVDFVTKEGIAHLTYNFGADWLSVKYTINLDAIQSVEILD